MRKLLIVLTIILAIIGIVFTILPMGTLAFIPVGSAILLSIIAIILSKENQKMLPKYLLLASFIVFLAVVAKDVFVKDKIVTDQQFDEKKVESKEEAKKELEELEDLN